MRNSKFQKHGRCLQIWQHIKEIQNVSQQFLRQTE